RDGELRPDTGDADEPLKEPPLGFVPEPVQRPAVFPHDELGGEVDALADGRQLLHDAERDGDLVADAARGLDHDAVGQFRGEASRDLGDHARRMCVSATATPSAASAGVGACFSLRSRAATIASASMSKFEDTFATSSRASSSSISSSSFLASLPSTLTVLFGIMPISADCTGILRRSSCAVISWSRCTGPVMRNTSPSRT